MSLPRLVTLAPSWFLACGLLAGPAFAAAIPEAALAARTVGIAQLENERPAEAEAAFRQVIQAVPADPLGHANLAIALLRQQKHDAALAAIEQALKLAPKRGDLLAAKAEILKWSGQVEAALVTYQAASAAQPDDVETQFQLYRHASSLRSPAAEAAADAALVRLATLRPENVVVLLRRAVRAIEKGDRAGATQALLRVKELSWQAPSIAGETLAKALDVLAKGDLEAARVPTLRLENVLKITPMFQAGQKELSIEIQGRPVERFAGEPPATAFGKPGAMAFHAEKLDAAPTTGRALAVGDFDEDGKPDLARAAGSGLELRRSSAGFEPSAIAATPPAALASLAAVDLDNDGHLDLLGVGEKGTIAFRGAGNGSFTPAPDAFGLGAARGQAAVAFDYDIEGDLDLAVAGAGLELYRNHLQGPLQAVGQAALPPGVGGGSSAALASDLDRDGDLDLLLAGEAGLTWLDNLRQGKFRDRTRDAGLAGAPGTAAAHALASADLDNDGRPDLVVAGNGLALFHNLSLPAGGGRFATWNLRQPVPAGTKLRSVVAFDADNDGRLDLAAGGPDGLWILLQKEDGSFAAHYPVGPTVLPSAVAAADLDADGDLDLLAAGPGGLYRLTNDGGNRNRWLAVRLRGLVAGNSKNNVFGLGSVLEVRAGRAYQFREATGEVTHLGLGSVPQADALRVVWTNGVPQNRLQPKGNQLLVEEQQLKGSCPFLYAWTGEGVEFVTDLLWGAPLGLPVAPGVYAGSDPRELVAVPGARTRGGAYELRVTEELWEAAFLDEVRLWVVDAPAEVEVASSLKIVSGESVPQEERNTRVLGARDPRPVAAAWDGRGKDATAAVAHRDEIYADGYEPSPYQGVAREWSFTFDLGEAPSKAVRLLLDGWIFPADASLNLAVAQRPDLPYLPPRLEVETAAGWKPLLPSMGHPAGKTKTMVVDTPPLPAGARRLRITTSLWLGWDRIAWTTAADDTAPRVLARLAPARAELAFRGFSALLRRSPNGPHGYDYDRVSRESPWLPFPGRYTRYGDVRQLLEATDDFAVILAPGDELALWFDAASLPPPAPGTRRSVFLESHGWDKDADRNTYEAAQLEPLPFAGMSGYPYSPGERYPATPAHEEYRREWLTREVDGSWGAFQPAGLPPPPPPPAIEYNIGRLSPVE